MGAVSELYAMQRSFSADRTVKHQSRSGDDQDGGAVVLDFLANVQSAEADIIEREEREEQAESKREFAALLRAYFKKILTVDEYKFLTGCIRQSKTLYQVGRALGVNANKTAESIESKCKASEKQFFLLMSYSGYDCRRGCEFMARLFNPDAQRRKVRDKIQARRMRQRERDRTENRKAYKRALYAANTEKERARTSAYRKNHLDYFRLKQRQYAAANREKEKQRQHLKYLKNREKELARSKAYKEAHRDEINAKRRELRARKRAEKERLTSEQAKTRDDT